MFKINFKTTERQQTGPRPFDYTHRVIGGGYYTTSNADVARQIQASLDGICFDNPDHNIETYAVVQVRTGRGNATIEMDAIGHVIKQLEEIQEELTRPRATPKAMAAE